ncbi:MAG: 2-oxoacid:acceptor oxidoreductase subunit alpha [Phycisphaeraceae bacterium]
MGDQTVLGTEQDLSPQQPAPDNRATRIGEHIVEIVADSGEGAQKAGQTFGTVSAKMGNGVWTVEIIPAEIKPPARSRAGASGIRIRIGSKPITNMGDSADLVVALNEQVPYGRINVGAYREGTVLLLENKWKDDPDPEIRQAYADALADFHEQGLVVRELPMEEVCRQHTPNPRLGKNMFVLGMLSWIYQRDIALAAAEIEAVFGRKGEKVVNMNKALLQAGLEFARDELDLCYQVPPMEIEQERLVLNGNQAIGLGVMAAGIEMVSMYPITPATSASHYLAGAIEKVGGVVHQAEDEIAAIGFAVGASYAGRTACTITSGPGMALKTEFIGLAVMAEVPLVIIDVQRGAPSTGLPTKIEQGDLLAALYGEPGDAPKPIMAPATIEECLHMVVTARQIAESFRTPVIMLSDANLATGVQPIARPEPQEEWLAPPLDQSPWDENVPPYDWDSETGISPRPVPGQRGGEYVLTGLTHTRQSKVAYDSVTHEESLGMRSRKLAALQASLRPPEIRGDESGDLLVVSWGSTLGAIEEAVDQLREQGHSVSSVHLRFLSPLEPGLKEIFSRFKRVMTVELNYSDPPEGFGEAPGRASQLATVLRQQMSCPIDYWSTSPGQPLSPGLIQSVLLERLEKLAPAGSRNK